MSKLRNENIEKIFEILDLFCGVSWKCMMEANEKITFCGGLVRTYQHIQVSYRRKLLELARLIIYVLDVISLVSWMLHFEA